MSCQQPQSYRPLLSPAPSWGVLSGPGLPDPPSEMVCYSVTSGLLCPPICCPSASPDPAFKHPRAGVSTSVNSGGGTQGKDKGSELDQMSLSQHRLMKKQLNKQVSVHSCGPELGAGAPRGDASPPQFSFTLKVTSWCHVSASARVPLPFPGLGS